MSQPPYVPQAGTIPANAVKALANAADCRLPTVPLLEACGQPIDLSGLEVIMASAIQQGLIKCTRDGVVTFWQLTEKGMAAARELIRADNAQIVAEDRALRPTRGASKAQAKPEVEVLPIDPVDPDMLIGDKPAAVAVPAPAPAEDDEEFAYTHKGRLLIRADGVNLCLSKEQAERLFTFTDQVRGIEWSEVAA